MNIPDLLKPKINLKQLFLHRLEELDISATASLDLLQIQHRTLYGIIEGKQ